MTSRVDFSDSFLRQSIKPGLCFSQKTSGDVTVIDLSQGQVSADEQAALAKTVNQLFTEAIFKNSSAIIDYFCQRMTCENKLLTPLNFLYNIKQLTEVVNFQRSETAAASAYSTEGDSGAKRKRDEPLQTEKRVESKKNTLSDAFIYRFITVYRSYGSEVSKSFSLSYNDYLEAVPTDFIFIVGEKKTAFFAHKAILRQYPYFQAMFRSGLTESRTNSAEMREIDAEIFPALLEFIYSHSHDEPLPNLSGNITIHEAIYNIGAEITRYAALKSAAEILMLNDLVSLCFLQLAKLQNALQIQLASQIKTFIETAPSPLLGSIENAYQRSSLSFPKIPQKISIAAFDGSADTTPLTEDPTDIYLKVGDDTITANRAILATRSLYFKLLLNIRPGTKDAPIVFNESIDPDFFRTWFKLISQGRLAKMAHHDALDYSFDDASKELIPYITEKNVVFILHIAAQEGLMALYEKACSTVIELLTADNPTFHTTEDLPISLLHIDKKWSPDHFEKIKCLKGINSIVISKFAKIDETRQFFHRVFTNYGNDISLIDLSGCSWVDDGVLSQILTYFPNIQTLKLSNCKNITDRAMGPLLSRCKELKYLSLEGCDQLTDLTFENLAYCSNLKSLSLSGCALATDHSISKIINCTKLHYLDITNLNQVSDAGLIPLIRNCPNLQYILTRYLPLMTDASVIALSLNCPQLKRVQFDGCENLTDKSLFQLFALCKNLNQLTVSYCPKLTDAFFQTLQFHSQLKFLCVNQCNISIPALKAIIASNPSLERISLEGIEVDDDFVLQLTQNCKALVWVYLQKAKISNISVIELMKLNLSILSLLDCSEVKTDLLQQTIPKCKNLACFKLTGSTHVNDAFTNWIASHFTELTELNLSGCSNISDLTELATKCVKLETLTINSCPKVTDSSIREFADKCKELKNLDLENCKLITGSTLALFAHHHLNRLKTTFAPMVTAQAISTILLNCEYLTELTAAYCRNFGDAAFLGGIKSTSIQVLNLSGTSITDATFDSIGKRLGQLKVISLNGCKLLTGKFLSTLDWHCPRLISIDIGNCPQITEAYFVVNLKKIQNLSIRGCKQLGANFGKLLVEKRMLLALKTLIIIDSGIVTTNRYWINQIRLARPGLNLIVGTL